MQIFNVHNSVKQVAKSDKNDKRLSTIQQYQKSVVLVLESDEIPKKMNALETTSQ